MPLFAAAVLSYAAGLLAGFGGLSWPTMGVAAVALAVFSFRRTATGIGVALSLGAGAIVAAGEAAATRACAQSLLVRRQWDVTVLAAASPGAFVAGEARACDAAVSISVADGEAGASSTVRVRGTATLTRRGVLIEHAHLYVISPPGAFARWRAAAGESIDAMFGSDAPLVRALLIADTKQLAPEIRDRYAAAGLAHMLSISGLHVGIIAYALAIALQLMRLSKRAVTGATILIIAVYVAAIGAPPPAVRSAVMLGALELSRALQRPTSPWAVLALGAVGPVLHPATVLDLGYQLSVAGVAALIAASRLARRILPRTMRGWRRDVLHGAVASTLATVVSAPLVAWTFGRVSIVGPLTNLVAAPLMGVAQPMLFAALVFAPLHPLARWIADAAHPLLSAFDTVALWGAAVPFARVDVAPTIAGAVLGGVFSAAVVVACVNRHPGRYVATAGCALAVLVWLPFLPARSGMVELHMLDVGQGDAVALRTAHGEWVLFDAGRAWMGGDAGRSVIVPYLSRRGGALEMFVLSHPHTDHVGGAATVIRALHPRRYVDAAYAAPTTAYRASLTVAHEQGTAWQRVRPGESIDVDGATLTFLAPDSAWTASLDDPNLASTTVLVRVGDVRFLLVGDAERAEEDWLIARGAERLRADVLKVGHHGSRTSSSDEFLDAVRPRVALISVGAGNMYGHPSTSVLVALARRGARVLRTDRSGTVVVRTDGRRLFVDADGDSWEVPPSSDH